MPDERAMVTAILLLSCPDQPGLVAAVSERVYGIGGNIVRAEQHIDRESTTFFQRIEFDIRAVALARTEIAPAFAAIVEGFGMTWRLHFSDEVQRVAVLVSKQPHCLQDVLARWRAGELRAEIPVVVSNHPDAADLVRFFGPAFEYIPVPSEGKAAHERVILERLASFEIDVVVLARYMQILSRTFIDRYRDRILNIHHSFLPAFVGARPYHQAHARGVKLIGATAHYATEDLDEGPILAQDVRRVSHRDSVEDLVRKGRDLERIVLAEALRAHLEHRVLMFGRKTVVFE